MSLIFGYDNMGTLFPCKTNGFEAIDNIAPVNLNWAGYKISGDINSGLAFNPHCNELRLFFDVKCQSTKESDRYFYVIDVFPHEFWNQEESKYIKLNDKVVNDIQSGRSKILVIFFTECIKESYRRQLNEILNAWGNDYNLPEKSIIIVSGNHVGDRIVKLNKYTKHIAYSIWEHKVSSYYGPDHINIVTKAIKEKYDRKKLFLCYNRRARNHRVMFVNNIFKEGLLENGLVSLGFESLNKLHPDLVKLMPLTIRNVNLEINQADNITTYDYLDTYFSIVTETEYEQNCNFTSEKIFKPTWTIVLSPYL